MKIYMNQDGLATVQLETTPTATEGTTKDVMEGNESVVIEGTEPKVVEGTDPAVVEGTEGEYVEGVDSAVVEVPEGENVEGTDPAVQEGTTDEFVGEGSVTDDVSIDMGKDFGMIDNGGMYGEIGMETPKEKGSVMSSWVFVIGITVATLAISVVLGVLLAKKRIKKGFDSYED